MDAPVTIAPQEFLEWPGLARLLAALNAPDERGAARVVGGAIRNALLGRPVTEVDVASIHPPDEVTRRARAAGFEVVPTGVPFGTVTVVAEGRGHEVTTLRRDLETDGRRATVVAFGDDWVEDARRRDLTINALYCDADGLLFDPLGGFDDVMNARVRFIGDADQRIAEDYLRVLRFFRFHAQYATGPVDRAGFLASARARGRMGRLSAERVRQELMKLLVAPGAVAAVEALSETGILTDVVGVADHGRFARLVAVEAAVNAAPGAGRRLAALAVRTHEDAERLASRLKISRVDADLLAVVSSHARTLARGLERRAVRRLMYLAPRHVDDLLLVAASMLDPSPPAATLRALRALPATEPLPTMPLRGADLLAAGFRPGAEVGRRLALAEDAWVAGDFSADHATLLAIALRDGGSP